MHDYNRTPMDVVKIVKIHESTLRKRLLEFGDTPSSVLTIDEFMTVDLEAEQDPPAFKAARKKDKEMIQKLAENDQEFSDLQREIEAQLEKDLRKNKRKATEATEGGDDFESTKQVQFITESTISTINECLISDLSELGNKTVQLEQEIVNEIAPDIMAICNQKDFDTSSVANMDTALANLSNSLEELDDDELNSYILTEDEAKRKNDMWKKLNAEYLTEKEAREERLAKEREEGKPEKKRRKTNKKRQIEPSTTAGEAIEKMLQEKKISNKINYDILKSLTDHKTESVEIELMKEPEMEEKEVELTLHRRKKVNPNFVVPSKNSRRFGKMGTIGLPVVVAPEEQASVKETGKLVKQI